MSAFAFVLFLYCCVREDKSKFIYFMTIVDTKKKQECSGVFSGVGALDCGGTALRNLPFLGEGVSVHYTYTPPDLL